MYCVAKCINGAFTIASEWSNLDNARVNYFSVCSALWNDKSSNFVATVAILDSNLRVVGQYSEYIQKEVESDSTTTEGQLIFLMEK